MSCTLYVVECVTPNTWYVGTTCREKHKRFEEHFAGVACKWTMRHGDGPERVRGGDVTIVRRQDDGIPDWLLPEEFGGTRRVDWGI